MIRFPRRLLLMDADGLLKLQQHFAGMPDLRLDLDSSECCIQKDEGGLSMNIVTGQRVATGPHRFTRHRLKISCSHIVDQPFVVEAGFLHLGSWVLGERNPSNSGIPSFSRLRRRDLLRPQQDHAWHHLPGCRRQWLRPVKLDASVGLLSTWNNPNWYHWLTLPGLGAWGTEESSAWLFSDRSIPRAIDRPLPELLQRVSQLAIYYRPEAQLYWSRRAVRPRELQASFIENQTDVIADGAFLNQLRQNCWHAVGTQHTDGNSYLYLRRGPKARRPLVDEEQLESFLRQRGFEVIDPAIWTPEETVRRFRGAGCIVAPHGAALANLMFCSPGARVLELLPGELQHYSHYALMSRLLGIQHSHLVGISVGEGFCIDQNKVMFWLDGL